MSDGSDTGNGRNDSGTGDGETTVDKYVAELRRRLRRLATIGQKGPFAFRGQADSKWKLESTANRRHDPRPSWEEFINYNCKLVADAKNANYHQKENNPLEDIEMLAELRHHSAATALIDFTRDFLVALWFACEPTKESSQEGKIFVVNTGNTDNFLQLTSEDKKEDLEKILRFQTRDGQKDGAGEDKRHTTNPPELWYWEPRFEINHRLSSQKGVFIFGKGDIPCQEEIKIPGEDKEAIREELSTLFGINEKSLFNDLPGFATINDVNHRISAKTEADHLRAGNSYYQQGEWEKAIEQYDKAIEQYDKAIGQDSECTEAYYNRGVAKLLLGRPEEALPDFDQAISLSPQYAIAYYNRGTAKGKLDRFKEALLDFSKAIDLNPQYAKAYNNRGKAKAKLGRPEEALPDLTQAIKLNPQHAKAYCARAREHAILGDTTAARADFNKALDLATKQDNKELAKRIQEALNQLPPIT